MTITRHMMISPLILYWLLGALLISSEHAEQRSIVSPQKDYYTAAIFEHARLGNWTKDTPEEIKRMNLNYYMRAAKIAKSKGADIILFPEYGIFPPLSREEVKRYLERVPDPRKGIFNPCLQWNKFLHRPMLHNLSCTARENEIVILANIGDIQPCHLKRKNCPADQSFQFNTNVVFDRNGTIISKVHKSRLFFEHAMDLPKEQQDHIFTTDFGTFASFISFEAMFRNMSVIAQDSRVDSIFLSSMWVETMPLSGSVQYWQGWAMGNKATLVASNIQIPGFAAVGSGVFTADRGPLAYTYSPDGLSKLLVSRVPKSSNQAKDFTNHESTITVLTENGTRAHRNTDIESTSKFPDHCSFEVLGIPKEKYDTYRCVYESTVNYTLVKMTKAKGHLEACNNFMCCSVDYSSRNMNETYYFGVANTTHNSHNRYYWCEEICLVARCDRFNDKECSTFPVRSTNVFQRLKLKANFTSPFIYPSVVKTGMKLAPISDWDYNVRGGSGHYEGTLDYKSSSENKPLLVAALNARCFDRDPPYIR